MSDLNRKAAGLGEYSDEAANDNERPTATEPEPEPEPKSKVKESKKS